MQSADFSHSRVLPVWIFPKNAPLVKITTLEEAIADKLPQKRSQEFKHSRGYVRLALSDLFKMDPLEIPLQANPGEPPHLGNGMGYISFSHCSDALLLAWCPERIGVDIERIDRQFAASLIAKRFFNEEGEYNLRKINQTFIRKGILQEWVIKEAAIKWERGKLLKGLMNWKWEKGSNTITNRLSKCKLTVHILNTPSWYVALTYEKNIYQYSPIVCMNRFNH